MRVIGVIDVRGTQAVHARAGQREHYKPIGDAVELARTYVDRHGLSELYVADLDAIAEVGRPFQGRHQGDPERVALRNICGLAPTWLDAAVSSVKRAQDALALGAAHVVVGLETLPSFDVLHEICDRIGGQKVAFSLDLRQGRPIGIAQEERPHVVAARAADRGAEAIIVIDLARVGTGTGIDLELIAEVRDAAPDVTLLVGGGVRGPEDLEALKAAGCDGALVATALQNDAIHR